MTTFWLITTALFIIALAIVWYAFNRGKKQQQINLNENRKTANVDLYHEHIKELDRDYAEKAIDQTSYQQLKAELSKTLLEDVSAADGVVNSVGKLSPLWPIVISVFICALTLYIYMNVGSHNELEQPLVATQADPHANLDMNQRALLRVQQLKQKVENEPTNSQAWFSLGQAFTNAGEFDHAVRSFDQVISLIGEHAELIGPKAQALYYKNDNHMNDEIQALIAKALELDPLDASTNVLLGMDTYAHHNYATAIKHWQLVLDSGRPGVNTQALEGAIKEAQHQLEQSQQLSGETAAVADIDPNAPRLTLSVSLSEEVLATLMTGADKTVFIYATASEGPRMPLAAIKVNASDLPVTVVLDDSLAMTEQMKLSNVDQVNVYAVVSMQGGVGIKPGDYKAEQLNVATVTKDVLQLTIHTLVK